MTSDQISTSTLTEPVSTEPVTLFNQLKQYMGNFGKPSSECKKCFGIGITKSWGKTRFGTCPSCYPKNDLSAISFKDRLKMLK